MAATLKVSARMLFTPSVGAPVEVSSGECSPLVGEYSIQYTQPIGTSSETITMPEGDTGTGSGTYHRYMMIRNLDPTNYVDLRITVSGTPYPFARLKPGDPAMFPFHGGYVLTAIADTAECLIQVTIFSHG